jgi:uncharacterized membrane protein
MKSLCPSCFEPQPRWFTLITWDSLAASCGAATFISAPAFFLLFEPGPDAGFLTTPQTLNVVVMAQQNQAGEHRNRESVLRFEPPDVERRNQRADDSPSEE